MKPPAKRSLPIQLQRLRALLDLGISARVARCDTRDVIVDALPRFAFPGTHCRGWYPKDIECIQSMA
eukprot:1617479-Lingulodinium_polyedra.AAC.1